MVLDFCIPSLVKIFIWECPLINLFPLTNHEIFSKIYRNFLDRIAIWQKALNIAIDEGIKVESHTKLIKIVKEWREIAQKNRNEGSNLEPWENLVLSIFDAPKNLIGAKVKNITIAFCKMFDML